MRPHILLLVVVLFFLTSLSWWIACDTSDPTPPNIIFLLTDDQRWDAMGVMGNSIIQTPNMDSLAQSGILFQHAYVTTPICAVSRASILSGQYARRHGIWDFSTEFDSAQWKNCYPYLLRQSGYFTGFLGKFGVGDSLPENEFDFWRGVPGQPRYEHVDEAGNYIHYTKILENQAISFLDSIPNDRPFSLSVSFKAPHVQDTDPRQFLYDSAYQHLFADQHMPPPRLGDSMYFERFPEFFKQNNEARRRWQMRFANDSLHQNSIKGYYRLIYGVDVFIGNLLQKLHTKQIADNTVIILMGDNGFFLGERGLAGKWYAYDESIHVPLFIYDPRLPEVQKGQIEHAIALNIDIAPTILSLAQIEVPSTMQGCDLTQFYTGEPKDWRKDFLFEHHFVHPRIPRSEGVVSLSEKYFIYPESQPLYEEYYDLSKDPGEKHNYISHQAYLSHIQKIKNRKEELIQQFSE